MAVLRAGYVCSFQNGWREPHGFRSSLVLPFRPISKEAEHNWRGQDSDKDAQDVMGCDERRISSEGDGNEAHLDYSARRISQQQVFELKAGNRMRELSTNDSNAE